MWILIGDIQRAQNLLESQLSFFPELFGDTTENVDFDRRHSDSTEFLGITIDFSGISREFAGISIEFSPELSGVFPPSSSIRFAFSSSLIAF